MSLTDRPSSLSESVYVAPDIEWRVLLSLAIAANPAEVVASDHWSEDLFASENAQAAFQVLVQSTAPPALQVPAAVDGVAAFADPAELQAARQTLIAFAQFRRLEVVQLNLAREVRRLASTRRVDGVQTLLDAARTALRTVELLNPQTASLQIATLGELAAAYWDRIAEQRQAAPTGLGSLDTALGGGLQPKRLFVVLGGPGSGKTTLINQIAERVANGGRPVVYLTTEDPMSTLLAKTIARLGRLDYGAVLQGRESERAAIDGTLHELAERRSAERLLYIEGNGADLDELAAVAQRHFARFADEAQDGGGPGVLVVDYLQRVARAQLKAMRSGVRDLREAVTVLTEDLRDLARSLNCAVIAVASQSRASGYGNANALSSAKESGDIEYTADVLMSLAKDEQRQAPLRHEARSLSLAKNRLGSQTTVDLDFRADRQQFTEAAAS
jgi:replicative DNA helicase